MKPTAFGTINDTFYIPAVLNEPTITKPSERIKVRYEVIGTLNKRINRDEHLTSLTTGKAVTDIKIKSSMTNIPLLGVSIGIDQEWLDQRVADISSMSFSHALHLNFSSNRKIFTKHGGKYDRDKKRFVEQTITLVPGSHGYSPESAKQTIHHLLKKLRTESNRLCKNPLKHFDAKKHKKDFKLVYGVIEFGAEHGGIHCHLLINIHPDISEEWIQEQWKDEGTAVLYDIRDKESFGVPRTSSMIQRTKAVTYVVSRALQYEGIGARDWTYDLGVDITLNQYDSQLVIADIPSHQIEERYWGKIKGSHRFRQQE